MDFWQRARSLAEEAASKTQQLTISPSKFSDLVSRSKQIATEASKKSLEFATEASKLATEASKKSIEIATEASKKSIEIATEASKKSIEIATEASKKSIEIATEASKKSIEIADQIKAGVAVNGGGMVEGEEEMDLERFGVTDDLRDFVKGITVNTFRDFPLQDDSEMSDIPTVSNVRQDLTAWQEKHAKIVLSTVKEISKLRYELCPRAMKERKFWRIYFILVNSHVSPYEKRYTEEAMLKSAEKAKDEEAKESSSSGSLSKSEPALVSQRSKSSSANEQDLDVFLLGDLGESDEDPDDGVRDFDDDFDKL